eukprot:2116849-Pyramimonas_sp.AAC.1
MAGWSATRARQPSRSCHRTIIFHMSFEQCSTAAIASPDQVRGANSARQQAGQSMPALSSWELRTASRLTNAEHRARAILRTRH